MGYLDSLADPSGLAPHGPYLLGQPGLIWLHVLSDGGMAVAYLTIPLALAVLVRRRPDLDFGWIYIMFAAFILSSGMTHLMSIVALRFPVHELDGLIKALTAVLSLVAAVSIWRLMPRALALPSPGSLQDVNAKLSFRIAESEDAERRLRESEARQRNIFIKLPAALYSLRVDGTVGEASEYMAELLGRTRADIIGHNISEFLPPGEWANRREALHLILEAGEIRHYESQFVTASGALIDVLISASLERAERGGADNLLTVVTDVTARRRAEAALRDSEERLRQSQKMEAIGKLTGGIAHDFNNMLTVIDGNLDRLGERLKHDAHGRYLLEQADHASRRASGLIEQLLAFSRKQRLQPRAVDVRDVIAGLQTLLSRVVGEQISLTIDDGANRSLCMADRNQLEAGLVNLVINATQAIQDAAIADGEIRITIGSTTVRSRDDWRDSGETPTPGEYVLVAVGDNGIGMSDEVRRRALEPFFTTKAVGKGSGLGLSQTYGFVCQSDGAMRIDSAPGRGTVIEMLLPSVLQAPAANDSGGPADAGGGRTQAGRSDRIALLVVEDEPAVLDIAASSLRESGFEVISAPDAVSALSALEAHPHVSLVFTDIVMPGQSGVAMAAEMWRRRPGLPVVFASGYSEESLTRQLPAGARFIKKPYKMSSVVTLIEAALSGKEAEAALAQEA